MAYLPVSEEPLAYILGPDSVLFDFRGSYTLIDNGAAAVPVTKHVRHINCALNSAPTSNFCNNLIQQNQTRLVPIVGTVVGGELKKKLEEQGFDPVVIKQTPAFDPHILHKNHSDGRLEVVVLDGGLKPSLEIIQKAVEKGDVAALEGLSQAHGMIFALVWYPAKKTDNVKRVLYTGSASPDRVITALEKSAPLAIFQVPSVTSGQASAGIKLPPRVRPSTGTSRSSTGAAPKPAATTRAAPAARPATTSTARPSLGARAAPAKPAAPTAPAASRPARPVPVPARTAAAAAPPKKPPVSAARKPLPTAAAAQRTSTLTKTTVTQKAASPSKTAPIQKPGAAKPTAAKAPEAPKKEPEVQKVEEKKEQHKPVEAAHEQHQTSAEVPLITLAAAAAAAIPASVPLVTFDDHPIEEPTFVAPVEHQESKPEVSSPHPDPPTALPETSFELAPEVRVIPATPEPPHVNHSEDEQIDHPHPPAPIPEIPEKVEEPAAPAPPPVHDDVPVPPVVHDDIPAPPDADEKPSDEIVVEPAPGFDEPIVPQPTGQNGLLDDLDEPMQIRRISMDTDRTDELAQQIAEMSINRAEEKPEEKEHVPEPAAFPDHHDAMMAAFSSVLTQGHQIHQDISGVMDSVGNTVGTLVNTVVNGGSDHNENTTDKSKLMETRSSVVEAGDDNKRYEETDPALDSVLASVTAQSEQEDRRRSEDGEGWTSVNSGAPAGVLSMTLVRRGAAPSHPRLSRERYFELVTVPHTGNKCSFTNADQARDFFASVRSRIYILASEDLPSFVLDGWLEGKKTWLRPEATSTIVPSTTTPAIQDFTTRQRSVLEEQNMKISPSIDHTKMVIQVEENPEELYAVKLLI